MDSKIISSFTNILWVLYLSDYPLSSFVPSKYNKNLSKLLFLLLIMIGNAELNNKEIQSVGCLIKLNINYI